jgi:hypothetical protein
MNISKKLSRKILPGIIISQLLIPHASASELVTPVQKKSEKKNITAQVHRSDYSELTEALKKHENGEFPSLDVADIIIRKAPKSSIGYALKSLECLKKVQEAIERHNMLVKTYDYDPSYYRGYFGGIPQEKIRNWMKKTGECLDNFICSNFDDDRAVSKILNIENYNCFDIRENVNKSYRHLREEFNDNGFWGCL